VAHILTHPKDLATSLIHFYGKAEAFSLAHLYANHPTTSGDSQQQSKWATAAAMIGELIEAEQRFRKLS
jgi:hypothetical protein